MAQLFAKIILKIKNRFVLLFRKSEHIHLLEMIWKKSNAIDFQSLTLNNEYLLRNFNLNSDLNLYKELLGITEMGECPLEYWYQHILPNGFFVIEHLNTGKLVGACFASHHPSCRHKFAGNLGWLAVHPEHRGLNIGKRLVYSVLERLQKSGYERIYLETHDFREPAILLYFRTGWEPYIYNENVNERWKKICLTLSIEYKGEEWKY